MCVSVCIYEFKPNQIEKNPFLLRHSKFRRLWLRVFSTFFLIMQCCYSHFKILIIIDLILTTLVKTSLATFLADRWLQFSKTTDRKKKFSYLIAGHLSNKVSLNLSDNVESLISTSLSSSAQKPTNQKSCMTF